VTRRLLPLALAVALTAVAPGCGGGESTAPVETTQVTMAKSYVFEPATIEVSAGATVTWTNDDNFTHTVEVEGGDDHEVEPGETYSTTFERAGTYRYVCTLHPDMDGEVIVR
jgi:plastocyanin